MNRTNIDLIKAAAKKNQPRNTDRLMRWDEFLKILDDAEQMSNRLILIQKRGEKQE